MTLSIFAVAERHPEREAVVRGGVVTSFAELAERCRHAARFVLDRGVAIEPRAPLRPVAVIARAEPETLELVHALIALGVPFLPVHPRLTPRERGELFSECRVERVFDPCELREGTALDPITLGELPAIDDDERCLAVVPTSGSTGKPRGVVLSRRAFAASARAHAANLPFQSDDRWLLGLPLAHVGGLSIVMRCLQAARAVVLVSNPRASFDAVELVELVDDERVTLLSLVPTQLERLLDLEPRWQPPPTLRAVLLGGAAASPSLRSRAQERGVPVLASYGLTEACSQVTTERPAEISAGAACVGRALDGIELRIVDGEILVRGATLFTSYHPAEKYPDPRDSAGWFRTGDLGELDDDGRLRVLGRMDDVIVTGGEKVHPLEVESVLEAFSGIHSACVFGLPDSTWGALVAAAVVLEPATDPNLPGLVEHFCRELAPFKRPRRLARLSELPLGSSGKLDRRTVAERATPLLEPVHG